MSKKHKQHQTQEAGQSSSLSHELEYSVIKSDLFKVLLLNVVYLAAIMLLYVGNQRSHFLDQWFARVLHF